MAPPLTWSVIALEYLQERAIAGERRLGIRLDDGTWWMLRRAGGAPSTTDRQTGGQEDGAQEGAGLDRPAR